MPQGYLDQSKSIFGNSGEAIMKGMRDRFTQPEITDIMRKSNIPGIKYLDQGSRRFLDDKSGYWKKYGTVREFLQGEYPKANKSIAKDEDIPQMWKQMFKENNRRAREATRNFVVFDENIPQILERNQQPIGGLLGK